MEPLEEVSKNIYSMNFQRAFQAAEENLRQVPFEETRDNTERYKASKELYLGARFFYSRRERIQNKRDGIEKARMFVQFLEEFESYLLTEIPKQQIRHSSFIKDIYTFIHSSIADGFAEEFAGQRAYNLNNEEILMLVYSLVYIKNYKSAEDVLYFMLQINSGDPAVNLVMGIVSYYLEKKDEFVQYFSKGLLIKPEVLENYIEFLPEGPLTNLWKEVEIEEAGVRCRKYAILLEINGILKRIQNASSAEAKRMIDEYERIKKEYQKSDNMNAYYKMIHLNLWLIRHFIEKNDFEQIDQYRTELMDYDSEIYLFFNEMNFK